MDTMFRPQVEFVLKRGTGLKACLFDMESKQMVSNLIPCSLFHDNDFFYFDYITNRNRTVVEGMACVIIARPSSLKSIIEELACPFYGSYIILFTSQIDPFALDILANADIRSLVSEVHEINLDLYRQGPSLYTTNSERYRRVLDGLASSLLSLEIHPSIKMIDERDDPAADGTQGQDGSTLLRLARDLDMRCNQLGLERRGTLVLLKRSFDLITPLMYDWHYQPMIYEHLAVDNSLVRIGRREHLLDDDFFRRNRFSEISTVGESIKRMVGEISKAQRASVDVIGESMALKTTAEAHLHIYNTLIDECISHKTASEHENRILSARDRASIKEAVSKMSDCQALKLILIYFLRWVKDWEEASTDFPKFRTQILRFQKTYKPRNYVYRNTFDTELDVKLGYVSPLRRIVKHLIMKRLRDGALVGTNGETRDISPVVVYIEGGVTMKEYREVIMCGEELKTEVILIGSEIINSQKVLGSIQ